MTDLPDPPANVPRTPGPGDRDVDARALDADERALAERIASAAPQRGPSAELDARILAMARAPAAATSTVPSSAADAASARLPDANAVATASAVSAARATPGDVARARRRRRWPAMAGVAATLTLTFGLAWQMRPQDAPLMEASDMVRAPSAKAPGAGGPRADDAADRAMAPPPVADVGVTTDIGASDGMVAEPAQRAAAQAAEGATQMPARRAPPAASAASAPGAAQGIAPAPPAPPAEMSDSAPSPIAPAPEPPPAVFDAPSPMDTPAPAPAAPPPPPSAPIAPRFESQPKAEPATAVHHREADMKQRRPSSAAAEADAAAAKSADQGSELDRIGVSGTRLERDHDQPLDDQPPASADSPAVRDAWLARVRQLIADGRSDDARDSLREYRRRHPEAPIPDDLRPLLPAE